jgi:hypothetical protein
MRITKRFGAFTALALTGAAAGVLALAPSGGAAAPPPIDASHDHVTCATMFGALKFSPGIGVLPVSGPMIATVKVKLDGCTDTDNANVKLAASNMTGTITYANNDSSQLLGKANVLGNLTITWKTAAGAAKLVAPPNTLPTSTLTFGQMTSALTSVTTGSGPFAGTDGMFSIGTAAAHGGNSAPSVSGNFSGSDSGVTSFFDGLSSQDVVALAAPVTSGKGLKVANLGVGQLHLG